MAAENPIGLNIPERAPPERDALVRPRDVEDWLSELPMAGAVDTGARLLRALNQINRTQLPAVTLIQIAELFTRPALTAIQGMERQFKDTGFPLSDKIRAMVDLCGGLHEALATAYKIAAHDTALGRIGAPERKVLVVSLTRAVAHFNDWIFYIVITYQRYPTQLWQEMHNLYQAGASNQVTTTQVKIFGGGTNEEGATLKELYTRALLLAAASPNRLRQREIAFMRTQLPGWARLVPLTEVQSPSTVPTRFYVPIFRDVPPVPSAFVKGGTTRAALELDTAPLLGVLRELFEQLPADSDAIQPGGSQGEISRAGVRRLIQAWGSVPKREFARTKLNFEMRIVVGLTKIHTLLNGDRDTGLERPSVFITEADPVGSESTLSLAPVPRGGSLDVESNLMLIPLEYEPASYMRSFISFGPSSQHERPRGEPPSSFPLSRPTQPVERSGPNVFYTANESVGGYCVNWRGRRVPSVKIGELVGIQSPSDAEQYRLAAVRRMTSTGPEELQVGLQVLAPSAVAASAVSLERAHELAQPILMVPEVKNANQPASLVAPMAAFKEGQRILLKIDEKERPVRLTRLLEATGAFARFLYEYYE